MFKFLHEVLQVLIRKRNNGNILYILFTEFFNIRFHETINIGDLLLCCSYCLFLILLSVSIQEIRIVHYIIYVLKVTFPEKSYHIVINCFSVEIHSNNLHEAFKFFQKQTMPEG